MGSNSSTFEDDEDQVEQKPVKKKSNRQKKNKAYQDVPETVPTESKKDEILKGISFKMIDEHACKAPHEYLFGTFWDLADYLTDEGAWEDDLVKVRSVFRWITSYNLKKLQIVKPPSDTVLEYFNKIQCNIGNHANLFYILCQMVDVPCVVIDGITKNSAYKIGEPLNKKLIKSQWNAVYIKDEWRLIDVYWAITCVEINSGDTPGEPRVNKFVKYKVDKKNKLSHQEDVDECYFFTDPYHLIWTHLADDEKWQLLPHPIKEEEWEKLVYVRERLHELGLDFPAKKYRRSILYLKQGSGHLELDLPPSRNKFLRFKFAFYRSRGSIDDEKDLDLVLNNYVKMTQTATHLMFDFDVPVCGVFNFEIYGKDANTTGLKEFDLMCTYSVRSPVPEKKPLPLPDNPEIGWGPNMKTMTIGLKPVTHKKSKILTDDGILEIRIQGSKEANLQMEIRSGVVDDATLTKYATLRWEGGQYVINTRLPKAGHYIMKINACNPKVGKEAENVLNYIIKHQGKQEIDNPFPNIENGTLGATSDSEKLGVRAIFNETGIVEASKGKAKIEIEADDSVRIVHEVDCIDEEAMKRMDVSSSQEGRLHLYDLDLPKAGEYSLNVYVQTTKNEFVNLYSFLIISTGKPVRKKGNRSDRSTPRGSMNKSVAITDYSEASVNSNKSNKPKQKIITKTLRTKDVEILVPAPDEGINVFGILTPKDDKESTTSLIPMRKDGSNWFSVPLTSVGEYSFNVLSRSHDSSITTFAKYRIRRMDINARNIDDPEQPSFDPDAMFKARAKKREDITKNFEDAIESRNVAEIEKAQHIYEANVNNSSELVEKAENTLKALQVRKDLLGAYEKRHIPTLERMINRAKQNNYYNILDSEIVLASRLCDRLNTMKNLRKEVMMTDAKAITELKRYVKPPTGVHEIMSCTLLLLGHPPWEIQSWQKCQAIISRTGKDSLKFKMADFEPRDVPLEVALDGKAMIEPFTEKQIRDVSPTAAAFHFWNTKQLREVESTALTLGGRNFAPDEAMDLETIVESEHSEPSSDTNVLPLTMENVNGFEQENNNANTYFSNNDKNNQSKIERPKTETLKKSRLPNQRPPSENERSNNYNGNPPQTSSTGKSPNSYLPPLSVTPRSGGSLTPKGNKSFEYRMKRRHGFKNLRKLGIIPDWKG